MFLVIVIQVWNITWPLPPNNFDHLVLQFRRPTPFLYALRQNSYENYPIICPVKCTLSTHYHVVVFCLLHNFISETLNDELVRWALPIIRCCQNSFVPTSCKILKSDMGWKRRVRDHECKLQESRISQTSFGLTATDVALW